MLADGQYSGAIDCAKQIVRREGFLGLYKGTKANLAKVMPFAALQFAAYEQIKTLFMKFNERQSNDRSLEPLRAASNLTASSRRP
mmetsp:Transcript_30012/g.48497  ORF Transcript_30012/g.48497 Transcript_30012/m.48497 type:complete len:85 (+) Transcript_30012:170-424(+)